MRAIEYIIQYVRDTWHCPVVFYTNAYYESAEYSAMVDALFSIQEKYDIGVIDLYTDTAFNADFRGIARALDGGCDPPDAGRVSAMVDA